MFVRVSAVLLGIAGAFAAKHIIEDPERIDREYFSVVKEGIEEGETYKVDNRVYMFQEKEETNIFNRELGLLDRVDKVLDMMGRKIELVEGGTKIVLDPFVSIRLESEDGSIDVGQYSNMFETRDELVQRYTNGDNCDICKGKKWSGSVIYRPDKNSIHLSGPIENSTCNYKLVVKGEELGATERIKKLIYTSVADDSLKEEKPNVEEIQQNDEKSNLAENENKATLYVIQEAVVQTIREAMEQEKETQNAENKEEEQTTSQ
ncbi:hypothetical protein NEFER03_2195 [Nematocida sp. LUAm3]|nr:hypothetical protein NEFER03_2195 [Nematocida sp. LUAm3]KAI5179225.1 hypothetical protein NEFER01_2079 [Nematocida sp. LUAm1]